MAAGLTCKAARNGDPAVTQRSPFLLTTIVPLTVLNHRLDVDGPHDRNVAIALVSMGVCTCCTAVMLLSGPQWNERKRVYKAEGARADCSSIQHPPLEHHISQQPTQLAVSSPSLIRSSIAVQQPPPTQCPTNKLKAEMTATTATPPPSRGVLPL
jgi:hypothetical protein